MCRTVIPTGFAFAAFVLSLSAVTHCSFVQFTSTYGTDTPITAKFGIFRRQTLSLYTDFSKNGYFVESCMGYPDGTAIDSNWRAAKAFSILPLIFGGLALVYMLKVACDRDKMISSTLNCTNSIVYLLATLSQGLSLLFLSSNACTSNILIGELSTSPIGDAVTFEETCSMATGAKCVISATVLWFLAAVGSADAYRYARDDERVVHMHPRFMDEPLLF